MSHTQQEPPADGSPDDGAVDTNAAAGPESGTHSDSDAGSGAGVEAEPADGPRRAPTPHRSSSAAQSLADDEEEIERLYTKPEVQDLVEGATAETQDRYLRILAEYDNFRRRTAKERSKWSAEGLSSLLGDLLPVFDSFDRARGVEGGDAAAMRDGIELTSRQLASALEKHDVTRIDPVGVPFDPRYHEALTRAPSDEHAEGVVLQVFDVGYSIGDRLLRAARVVVSAGPGPAK